MVTGLEPDELERMPRRAPHPLLPLVGARLKHVRAEAGWSQQRLAEAAGISTQAVSQYENGKMSLRISTLLNIATALRVGVGALLDVNLPLPEAGPPPEGSEILKYYLPLEPKDRALAVRLVRDVAADRG